MNNDSRPLIAHVVFRFDTGGLENGVVNLINGLNPEKFRHVVIALTEVTDFRHRIRRDDVQFISLHKPPGHGIWLFPKLFRLFRRLRPAIVHSRNLAALEAQLPAWFAGVPVRIHGEHGRDIEDLDGSSIKYQRVRRFYRPFVSYYIALSPDLANYLITAIRVPKNKVLQIFNGVDSTIFHPPVTKRIPPDYPYDSDLHWVVGTVGRLQTVKDQPTFVRAFIRTIEMHPNLRDKLRLAIVGNGPLLSTCRQLISSAQMEDLAWLPGERSDIPEIMRNLHCFVLPSLAEGISNTILEAMASGLPVIATNVGGNADLIDSGKTGMIVPSANSEALALEISKLATNPAIAAEMGMSGRKRVEEKFSLGNMVTCYQNVYDNLLHRHYGDIH